LLLLYVWFSMHKGIQDTSEDKKKCHFYWYSNMWKWCKALSYTIRLSVITKEYKEVPLVQWKVAPTPQNIYTAPDTRCLEEHQREAPFFLHWIISQLTSVEPIERWLHHDAWCEYWRSSSLIENNISRDRNAGEHSDSTRPTGVGRNPSLNEHLYHQKGIRRAWIFRPCYFFE